MTKKVIDENKVNPQNLHAYSTSLLQGKAYSRLHTHLTHVLNPFAISIPEWKLLGQLYEQGDIKPSELASLLNYDPPMVTKLTKKLEKKGFLKRTSLTDDERTKLITITKKGGTLILQLEPIVKELMKKILNGITIDELFIYLKVLTIIVKNTEK